MSRAETGVCSVYRALAVGFVGIVVVSLALVSPFPDAAAAPLVPDIDSLIDDSGPLPSSPADLNAVPTLWFSTATGLLCKEQTVKVTHQVACAGDLPGQLTGTHIVDLQGVYDRGLGPARFVAKTSEEFFGDTANEVPVQLAPGHKIVFWSFPPSRSLVCGVPASADLVCVLKAPHEISSDAGPSVTHGFVIAAPKSWVF
ncbi:hypothetical protein AOT83_19020 [Mycobacteroides sp. H001]|uniref:hypothetical protein n=1 Tax=Mycobacteroides TaxID=670516 RepID=UPI0007129D25|nr:MULTISPECIES: hypothetical protein [Mycobacteroides]KRQ26420.1 hypothetical protein AOT86_11430 [Mycobacteroides sp. H072]KRQ32620.1 hypothetical protein AOT84_20700 [Mycobacteroides sp. H002]KRQ54046.1 hypothetical protein AOT85_05200 [Mycobacteroides sp. H054]KRQ68015.1 hypothetical protein AOT83_19020 [Mycobacteroides sp. H001]OHU42831.1 hypothetical protein BKG79_02205 [Mycobacteroides chelonae]